MTIGYRYAAVSMRMTRSAMLEVLREDYIRTARAKGLINKLIINRHALKNAMLPVVTVIGIEFAFLIGGLVVTEQVFNLNGIGRLMVLSVQNQDYTLTQALVMLVVTHRGADQSRRRPASMPGSTRASGSGLRRRRNDHLSSRLPTDATVCSTTRLSSSAASVRGSSSSSAASRSARSAWRWC